MAETIAVEQASPHAVITLQRPEVRNAFDDRMIRELTEAFEALSQCRDIRIVTIRGAGKIFSAGADMNWMRRMKGYSTEENERDAGEMAAMFHAMRDCPAAIIGRVQGAAIGGGAGLVAACDIVVAAADAVFAFSEVRLGIVPAVISPHVIERIGVTAARRYMMTGSRFDAAEALRIGLISDVVESEAGLDDRIESVSASLLKCGPLAVASCKALIHDVVYRPAEEVIGETVRRISALRVSDEAQEGLGAFLDKRRPGWMSE